MRTAVIGRGVGRRRVDADGAAVYGGSALAGIGGTLIAAAAAEIGRDAAENLAARPDTPSPEVRRAGVREAVLNPDGTLPGEPGKSPGVRMVEEQQAEQIDRSLRERLGPPDQVIAVPGKGQVEIWKVRPDDKVVIRDFSTSGHHGSAGDKTIDIKMAGTRGGAERPPVG